MLALVLVLVATGTAPATVGQPLLDMGREAYATGRFAEAANSFEGVANQEAGSAALYLDTATAWRLAGDPGRAALWLCRAGRAAPGDAAVQKALAAAGLPRPAPGLVLGNRLSPRAIWSAALAANAVFWLSLALARLLGRRIPRGLTAMAGAVVLWLWCEAGWLALTPALAPRGVTLVQTPARCAPEDAAESLFTLPPGVPVGLGPVRQGYQRVDAGADRLGWVSRDAVAPVVPESH
jgi:hypothetical protein